MGRPEAAYRDGRCFSCDLVSGKKLGGVRTTTRNRNSIRVYLDRWRGLERPLELVFEEECDLGVILKGSVKKTCFFYFGFAEIDPGAGLVAAAAGPRHRPRPRAGAPPGAN